MLRFTFWEVGEYGITLVLLDLAGNVGTDTVNVTVVDTTPPRAITHVPERADMGVEVELDGSLSTDNTELVGGRWTFMVGGLEVVLEGLKVTYTFEEPGEYTLTLIVVDSVGLVDSIEVGIVIRDTIPPVAVAGENMTIVEGTTIMLDATGSSDNIGVEEYSWDIVFGGIQETLPGAVSSYRFINPGKYTVKLNVKDAAGNTDNDILIVKVVQLIQNWNIGPFLDGMGKPVKGAKVVVELNGTTYEMKTNDLGLAGAEITWFDLIEPVKVTATKSGYKKLEFEIGLDEERKADGNIPVMKKEEDTSAVGFAFVLLALAIPVALSVLRRRIG